MSRTAPVATVAAVLALLSSTSAAATVGPPAAPSADPTTATAGLPAWDRVPTPNIGSGDNQLYGVDALGPDDLWAVGYSTEGLRDDPLVEHFDGSAWSIVPSPDIGESQFGAQLLAVDAIAPDDVWAVGGYGNQYSLIMHWDGTEWLLVDHPNPAPLQRLYAVRAAGPDDVWAVGYRTSGGISRTHVLHWNGDDWVIVASPNGSGGHNQLLGVDVVAPDDVWAVGEYDGNSLTLHWDGSTWTRVASPSNTLYAVSAVDHDDVWAVGTTAGNTLTEHWDGTSWSVVPSPPGDDLARLYSVHALASNDVWAAGYSSAAGTLAIHWDGSAWEVVPSPNRAGPNFLRSLTSVASDDVVLVGEADFATLVERWDGTDIEIEPSADEGIGQNDLRGVHVGAPGDVWAVGTVERQTLTQHWDGTEFSIVESPSKPDRDNVLEDVDGTSPDDVWAVGHHDSIDFIGSRPLALHWDGSAWDIVRTPAPARRYAQTELLAVASITSDDAWAVGSREVELRRTAFVLHWDGSTWERVRNSCGTELSGITAFASDDVWAIGGVTSCHWNGRRWRPEPVEPPDNPQDAIDLVDLDGVSGSDLWAVGIRYSQCGESVCTSGDIQYFDGSAWSRTLAGAPPLDGVDAIAVDDVWAVGFGGVAIWHYDGAAWTEVPPPDLAGNGQASLTSVEGSGRDDLWAVGPQIAGTSVGASLALHARAFDSGAVVGDTNVADAVASWFGPESGSHETDPFGEYQVGGLETGTYTFIVTREGCTPATREVTVQAGTTIREDIPLDCRLALDRPGD